MSNGKGPSQNFAEACETNKIASRCGAPRPPMTDVGTETAFRLDQRKHFRTSLEVRGQLMRS